MTPDTTALVAAAIRLRGVLAPSPEVDQLHQRARLVVLERHWPELFEAIGDVLVATNPPPSAAQCRQLHPANGTRHTDDVGGVHPHHYPDPEGDAA